MYFNRKVYVIWAKLRGIGKIKRLDELCASWGSGKDDITTVPLIEDTYIA